MKRFSAVQLSVMVFFLLSVGPPALHKAYAEGVGARAAVVIDSATEKILYAKNPQWKLAPASTTKLVTAMVVLDTISPDTVITISENAADTPSVTPHLRAGERFTVRDILYLALMRSVNGAAVALAEAAAGSEPRFTVLMNEKVARLGAENTRFINASGLPGPGQYITAFDLSKVMKQALSYPLIKEIITTRTKDIHSVEGRRIFIKSTDQLLWMDEDLLGGKTGYTREARHCFVCAAQKGGYTLISSVLGESVRDDLWHDSQILLDRGYDVIQQKAEPVIYFSSAEERPVVLASYKRAGSGKRHKMARHRLARSRRLTAHQDKISTGEKGYKKRRSGHIRVARKSKKSSGKNLS
ncbi:MAG: serine hydrolase [Dissulfurispiraceae bacterium]|jgi:D-alanyl-D-alanine carboxypeptidase (penicillin-binding protein 5/6)